MRFKITATRILFNKKQNRSIVSRLTVYVNGTCPVDAVHDFYNILGSKELPNFDIYIEVCNQ
jgi:hypothetical protein